MGQPGCVFAYTQVNLVGGEWNMGQGQCCVGQWWSSWLLSPAPTLSVQTSVNNWEEAFTRGGENCSVPLCLQWKREETVNCVSHRTLQPMLNFCFSKNTNTHFIFLLFTRYSLGEIVFGSSFIEHFNSFQRTGNFCLPWNLEWDTLVYILLTVVCQWLSPVTQFYPLLPSVGGQVFRPRDLSNEPLETLQWQYGNHTYKHIW